MSNKTPECSPKQRAVKTTVRKTVTGPDFQKSLHFCEGGIGGAKPASSFALARAAIAAMREPTEEMIVAWIKAPGAIKGGWQGMIDAALEGK